LRYTVIYLENHKCKICEAIERNVIEPVAVFVPGREYKDNLKSELEKLNSEQLEKNLQEHYQNVKGKIKTKIPNTDSYTYQTCIFHCEKENEIWMENFNDGYEDYAKHRDKAIQHGKYFNEEFEIKWDLCLINKFWDKFKAYIIVVRNSEVKKVRNEDDNYTYEIYFCELFDHQLKNNIEKEVNFYEKYLKEKFESTGNIYPQIVDCRYFIFPNFLSETNSNTPNDLKFLDEDFFFQICEENDNFFYSNITIPIDFSFSYFLGKVFFKNLEIDLVRFNRCIFYQDVNFLDVTLKKFYLTPCLFFKRCNFNGVIFKDRVRFIIKANNIYFNKIKIKKDLFILFYGNFTNNFVFSKIDAEENSHIEIRNLKAKNFLLQEININRGNYLFFRLNISENFVIKNSVLDRFKFIDSDFSNNDLKIELIDSSIISVEFINTSFGKVSEKRICSHLFENDPFKARDIYRQFKHTFDSRNDFIIGNDFYSIEMKAHEKYLKSQNWNKNNWQEKLVFIIHKWASNFGQSWIRPLIWIIISALTFTGIKFLYKINFPYNILPDKIGKVLNAVAIFLNEFAKSLIPLFANKKEVHGLEFVSLLFSVIIAFFVYQFIVAVRRKVKR